MHVYIGAENKDISIKQNIAIEGKPKDDPRYYIKHCVLSFFLK